MMPGNQIRQQMPKKRIKVLHCIFGTGSGMRNFAQLGGFNIFKMGIFFFKTGCITDIFLKSFLKFSQIVQKPRIFGKQRPITPCKTLGELGDFL